MGDHAVLDAERAFVLQEHDLVAGSKVASTILGSEPIAFADNTPLDEGGTRQFVERTNVTTQMRQNECRFGRIVIAGPVSDQRGDGIRLERETTHLTTLTPSPISRQCSWTQFEPAVAIGVYALILSGIFALRVAVKGNAVFATSEPKRIRGRRALYGDADWMSMQEAAKLFPRAAASSSASACASTKTASAQWRFAQPTEKPGGRAARRRSSHSMPPSAPRTTLSLPAPVASRRPRRRRYRRFHQSRLEDAQDPCGSGARHHRRAHERDLQSQWRDRGQGAVPARRGRRLGFMRILETARDAGRKYGITLVLLFQSIGQMRETYGGSDAASKWFESASWVSFAAVNDPETAEYISKRCARRRLRSIRSTARRRRPAPHAHDQSNLAHARSSSRMKRSECAATNRSFSPPATRHFAVDAPSGSAAMT